MKSMIDAKTEIGQKVRAARIESGLSMVKLARLSGVSVSTVRRLETEERKTTGASLMAILVRTRG